MATSKRSFVGVVLLLAGTVLFAPALGPETMGLPALALVPATVLLSAGTYLVGTDVAGAPARGVLYPHDRVHGDESPGLRHRLRPRRQRATSVSAARTRPNGCVRAPPTPC